MDRRRYLTGVQALLARDATSSAAPALEGVDGDKNVGSPPVRRHECGAVTQAPQCDDRLAATTSRARNTDVVGRLRGLAISTMVTSACSNRQAASFVRWVALDDGGHEETRRHTLVHCNRESRVPAGRGIPPGCVAPPSNIGATISVVAPYRPGASPPSVRHRTYEDQY